MQLIYIHGLNSDSSSIKGQMLEDWCTQYRPEIKVLRPDLNVPPKQVMQLLGDLIAQDSHTRVVGSSLGGFYATACVAKHAIRAVLVNPSVRPFERFKRFFDNGDTVFQTDTGWEVTPDQLDDLRGLFQPVPAHPSKILVLLKQGDEMLDYREAESYFSQDNAQCPLIVEPGGDHFMHDMQSKIPLMMNFLFDR